MVVFEIFVNDQLRARIGGEELAVLGVQIDALGILGNETRSDPSRQGQMINLGAGGVTAKKSGKDEHLSWLSETIQIGDVVKVKIVEDIGNVDKPRNVSPLKSRST